MTSIRIFDLNKLISKRAYPLRLKRICYATALLLLLSLGSGVSHAQFIDVPMDAELPDFSHPSFASGSIIESTQNGAFSSSSTWQGGAVPGPDDTAVVNDEVSISGNVTVADLVVVNGGQLNFATSSSTELEVGTFQIQPGGVAEIGTKDSPVTAGNTVEIVFRDIAPGDTGRYGTGMIVLGKLHVHGVEIDPTFARLESEPLIGDSVLVFDTPVSDWSAGDRLAIPDTRQLTKDESGLDYEPQWEEITIDSVSVDGLSITLTAPLTHSHIGARDGDGMLQRLPHVMNLSRNIEFRSQDPSGTRGHVLVTHRADLDVRYARFSQLGRTTIATLDATNLDGRHPVLLQSLMGPTGLPADTPQFSIIGNAFDGGSETHTYKWALGINDSHYGHIAGNVVYNAAGAGIIFRGGNESENVLENNFVMRVIGTGNKLNTNSSRGRTGSMGAGYWFGGNSNYIRNNVGANTSIAPDATGWTDFDSIFFFTNFARGAIPNFKGADTSLVGEFNSALLQELDLLEFSGNEAYGATSKGLQFDRVGNSALDAAQIYLLSETSVWHSRLQGIELLWAANFEIDGMTIFGDSDVQGGIGVYSDASPITKLRINDLDVQGMATGISIPSMVEQRGRLNTGMVTVTNSYLRNPLNLTVSSLQRFKNVGDVHLAPRDVEIRNLVFESPATCRSVDIDTTWELKDGTDAIQDDQVRIYDFNGIAGNDFELFFLEQHPDFEVPETTYMPDGTTIKLFGASEGGLSNQQALNNYGIANRGQITPCFDTTTYPTVNGFACNISDGSGIEASADSDGDGVANVDDDFPLDASASSDPLEICEIVNNGDDIPNNSGGSSGGSSSGGSSSGGSSSGGSSSGGSSSGGQTNPEGGVGPVDFSFLILLFGINAIRRVMQRTKLRNQVVKTTWHKISLE